MIIIIIIYIILNDYNGSQAINKYSLGCQVLRGLTQTGSGWSLEFNILAASHMMGTDL